MSTALSLTPLHTATLATGQVNDRIMLLILADLLGGPDNDPPEESVEVRCR